MQMTETLTLLQDTNKPNKHEVRGFFLQHLDLQSFLLNMDQNVKLSPICTDFVALMRSACQGKTDLTG